MVRWAVFSCALVPLVLLWYGTSLAGAAGTALGLAAVTGVCRLLLRRAERRAAAAPPADGELPLPHRETGATEPSLPPYFPPHFPPYFPPHRSTDGEALPTDRFPHPGP
ncbi:hypothetical protein ABZX40_37380 [Streptomyces sp. NPDC004610]|uniref:hypothetical protein n=1 Tax=unclassified Streptomyces TaxID=2593676 RepID=UPI0033A23CE3